MSSRPNQDQETKFANETPAPSHNSGKPAKPAAAKKASPNSSMLGNYQLKKLLGKGGMGEVYLAEHIKLGRKCAVKVMAKQFNDNPTFVERFQREAKAMAKLDDHPNIVRVFDVDIDRRRHYVAMEFVDGHSMEDWIRRMGKLSIGDALHILVVCAQTLARAHEMKIIHRDIKPDNILVTKEGLVKVADLGLAKEVDDDQSVTRTGTGMGTPHYMPPEQAKNAKYVDHRSDIYAMGCMMFRFLTGDLPFSAETTIELIQAKEMAKQPPSAKKINPEVPQGLDDVVAKMTMKDPNHRYQSCEELLQALNALTVRPNESLEFINSKRKALLGNGGSSLPTSTSSVTATPSKASTGGSSRANAPRESQQRVNQWVVKFADQNGRIKELRASTARVQELFKAGLIDLKAKVARIGSKNFVPISQVREFDDMASKMQTKVVAEAQGRNLSSAYEKIDKQYQRQKFIRYWKAIASVLFGWIGLFIWLALVCGVLILFWKYLPDFVRLGIEEVAKYVGLAKENAAK